MSNPREIKKGTFVLGIDLKGNPHLGICKENPRDVPPFTYNFFTHNGSVKVTSLVKVVCCPDETVGCLDETEIDLIVVLTKVYRPERPKIIAWIHQMRQKHNLPNPNAS